MHPGAITSYIDVAQLTLYGFWFFFAGLIFYLRREDKREGYPLVSDDGRTTEGFPPMPPPKTYILQHGAAVMAPRVDPPQRVVNASPVAAFPGAPMEPNGNPLLDGVGPAAYALRADEPDLMFDHPIPKIVPLRVATDIWVTEEDPDPRGMSVIGACGNVAGTVTDVWVDRSEMIVRYLEAEVASAAGPRQVIIPMPLVKIGDAVKVSTLTAAQIADTPPIQNPNQITFREEDRISAYYGGGQLYATPARLGPLL
jgi:photosynthetic reaction center H subunit